MSGSGSPAHPWLLELIRKRLDPRVRRFEDSWDILQEALMVVAKNVGQRHRKEPERFLYYLEKAIHHKTISANRRHLDCKKRQDARYVDFSAEFTEENQPLALNPEAIQKAEARETWEGLVEKQREPLRTILRMKFQGCTNQEIADHVHLNERTIRKFVDELRKRYSAEWN